MKTSFKGSKPSILQRFPESTVNPNTVHHLGDSDEPIEVFPPEIFFKGKQTLKGFRRFLITVS